MCGIIGCVGHDAPSDVLLTGLDNLEYRGYDSAGIALANTTVDVVKREGKVEQLRDAITNATDLHGEVGIAHTRWSTHGPPSDANAHPHTDCIDDIAVVHNGIIENYQELRDELRSDGHTFESETDSEVVPHLIEDELTAGRSPEAAFRHALTHIEGSYALAVVFAERDVVFATRNDSPLVLGIDTDAYYLASDVPAFLEFTDRVVYLEDGEVARLAPTGWTVTDATGTVVDKDISRVEWDAEETAKSGYDHYMLKEIHEQPNALRQCIRGRVDEVHGKLTLDDLPPLDGVESVQFVACGTSYHAALYGAGVLREAGIPAQAFLASEYATNTPPIPETSLVIGVTQSGETADTLSALREAQRQGRRTFAITNVVGSTAARECDHALYIRAGPEIGVAATKTFSSQAVALRLFAESLTTTQTGIHELVTALRNLPSQVQTILDTSSAEAIANEYVDAKSYFFIGRGSHYPVALEGALKLKEISYKHAEGFPAGELKHGPLALVSAETPVFAIVTGDDDKAAKTIGNVKEVEAREAPVVAVTDGQSDVMRYADHTLEIPETHPALTPILANVQLQLVSYHVAKKLGRSIDKPRNLAKSVTVE
jgi:glucosamine--fructose-6-phosphate aminotransferase (isomerizing)